LGREADGSARGVLLKRGSWSYYSAIFVVPQSKKAADIKNEAHNVCPLRPEYAG
jgi:hypothetical protein